MNDADIERLATILVRDEVLGSGEFRIDSCIVSVRILYDVLTWFGIDGRPIQASAIAYNERWRELMDGPDPQAWRDDPAAWSVGLGQGDDVRSQIDHAPGKPPIHLVLLTAEAILDPSLDQASRPDKGLTLGPGRFLLPPNHRDRALAGERLGWIIEAGGARTYIEYVLRPTWKHYTSSPNWGHRDRADLTRRAGKIIRALRKAERVSTETS